MNDISLPCTVGIVRTEPPFEDLIVIHIKIVSVSRAKSYLTHAFNVYKIACNNEIESF